MSFQVGTTINDRYRLDGELGQGGMGVVFAAFDNTLQREVAVKLLSNARLGTEGRSRLLQEAQLTAKLDHPNIVTVFDAGEFEETPYIVMQYIEGKTLAENKPTEFSEIVEISKQICTALEHAHQHEIIHRDLKPENVIITPDGTLKLMDFGLARSTASRLTEEGTMMGTVFYMSPEQALGDKVDARTDLYALGAMLYEICTGSLPFTADNPIGIITQHIHASLVPPNAKRADLPPRLNNLILALLGKEPDDRPPSAQAVLEIFNDPDLLETQAVEVPVLERIRFGGLVGREEEVKQAKDLWQKALSGEGQVLLISGEPGVGKTRLMHEIITQGDVSGGIALVGESYAESNVPYGAIAQIIRRIFERFEYKIPGLLETTLGELIKLAPGLDVHFPNITPQPALDPETEQQRMLEHMVAFCKVLTEQHPLLLVVDDIHWADSGTLAVFQHLARRTKALPVMLLGTYREIELRAARPFNDLLLEFSRQRIGTRLKLERLSEGSARMMLGAIFQTEISDDFLDGIYRETEGNPFFIEEICRALVDSGKLYFEDGEWHRPSIKDMEIPQGIQVAVESRLGKLPKDCQDTLAMAAIIGREFEFDVLEKALAMSEDSLIEALETAEGAQMIEEVRGRGEITYHFVHALVPQAIQENTSGIRQRRMHIKIAAAFEDLQPENYPALAYHHGKSANDEQALKYYTLAGETAQAAFMNADAEQYLLAAMELTDEEILHANLLSTLGEAYYNLGDYPKTIESWQRAIELYMAAEEKDQAAWMYARYGRATWNAGDYPKGLAICKAGLEAIGTIADGPGMANLLHETGRAAIFNYEGEEAFSYCRQALEMAERIGEVSVQLDAFISLALDKSLHFSERIKLNNRAIEQAKSAGLLIHQSRALINRGDIYFNCYLDIDAFEESTLEVAELAQTMGNNIPIQIWTNASILKIYPMTGALAETEERLDALQQLDLESEGISKIHVDTTEGRLDFYKGELGRSAEKMLSIYDILKDTGDLQLLNEILVFLGEGLQAIGEFDEAEKYLQEAINNLNKSSLNTGIWPRSFLVQTYLNTGRVEEAHTLLADIKRIEEKTHFQAFDTFMRMYAEFYVAVEEGNWQDAGAKFEELDQFSREKGLGWHIAYNQYLWGQANLRREETEAQAMGRVFLQNAIDSFENMGAAGFVKRIQEMLAETQKT